MSGIGRSPQVAGCIMVSGNPSRTWPYLRRTGEWRPNHRPPAARIVCALIAFPASGPVGASSGTAVRAGRLPAALTSLIGREREIAAVRQLLEAHECGC